MVLAIRSRHSTEPWGFVLGSEKRDVFVLYIHGKDNVNLRLPYRIDVVNE